MRWFVLLVCALSIRASAQTTQPAAAAQPVAAQPATAPSEESVLDRMLKPSDADKSAALLPQAVRASSGDAGARATTGILREGTDVIDRLGRLQKSADGQQATFVFDSDGKGLGDTPLIILPNLKLMSMENAVSEASHDLRFRITGTVTEYHGRNYILLEKVVVVQDRMQEF